MVRLNTGLSGKSILIVGASAGIGAALGREFAGQGASVLLAARRLDRVEALATEIKSSGGSAFAFECDVTSESQVQSLIAALKAKNLPVDILVVNAGFGVSGRFQDLNLGDYRRQFETNVFGAMRIVYAALDELRRRRGQIVLIGSVAGHVPSPGASAYSMSKFAIRALSQGLRGDLRDEGIRVTLISPGFVDSDLRRTDNQGQFHPGARDPIPAWIRMPTDRAARKIAAAVLGNKRDEVITAHGKFLVWIYRHLPWALNGALERENPLRQRRPRRVGPKS
jgi:short-subunit dehydrogenase